QRFLFIIVLTLPFDIRDLGLDEPQLGTIPQLYGTERVKLISVALLSLVAVLEIFKTGVISPQIIVLMVILAITYYLVQKSTRTPSTYLVSFWIEGVPILWWALLLLASS